MNAKSAAMACIKKRSTIKTASIHPVRPRLFSIKLIVNKKLRLSDIESVRKKISTNVPIYLQPESNLHDNYQRAFKIYREAYQSGHKNIRLGIQMHKIYNIK